MTFVRQHRLLTFVAVVVLAFVLVTGGFGLWVAGEAGRLPWQVDPTRVSLGITPFSGTGLTAPTAVATATATPTS
jgi:hypothetical protein